ncbi:hypothetical protein BDBG_16216, partial [Blastomyces gilchristii SLH14081]
FSYIDRFISADNYNLNIKLLIENLRNVIMKKLSVLYITESSISFSTLSVSFSTSLSQSLISVSVSDSPASAISVSVILTSASSVLSVSAASAFIISSLYFEKMLYRFDKLCFSRLSLLFNSIEIIKIVLSFIIYKVIMFTDIKKLFITVKFNIMNISTLMNFFEMIDLYQSI